MVILVILDLIPGTKSHIESIKKINEYMKVVILKPPVRGAYWTTRGPSRAGASYGPINLDSYSSWTEFNGIFDRFEKKSFWAKIGRSEVGKVSKIPEFPYDFLL